MLQHARDNDHHFRKDDVTVLCSEHDWVKRGSKEAIYIKALTPSINIDPGRHSLSSHFDTILKSVISAPPPPTTHDAENESLINTAPRRQGRPASSQTLAKTIASSQTLAKTIATQEPQLQQQQQPQQQPQPQRQSQRLRNRQQHSQNPGAP